jgi:hypothetical protein
MSNRTCKPDADLKRLWRLMLGTPFPPCGVTENSEEDDEEAAPKSPSEELQSDGV